MRGGAWLILSSLATFLLGAHAAYGSITGIVTDAESGTPIAGAVVSLVDLDRNVLTDPNGRYVLHDVPPGPQHVAVRRVGYAPQTFHALVPGQGALEIHVALRPVPIKLRTVDVHTAVPIRGLEEGEAASYPDRGLSPAAVRHHPLLSEPDVFQAMGGGEVALRPESPSGIHVRGAASDQITYLLDGIPVFSPYHAAGTFGAWNADALSHLELVTLARPPEFPEALAGALSARTRAPGFEARAQGSLSTTQARGTVDGPLGRAGAGYLVSLRSTFPGLLFRKEEPSHLQGDSNDWLAKLESPLMGGRLRLLGYGAESEIEAAAEPETSGAPPDSLRNHLAWRGRSVGAGWLRHAGDASIHLRVWGAAGKADATWRGQDSLPERLAADRHDAGFLAAIELRGAGSRSMVGIHAARSRTSYWFRPDSGSTFALNARTPVAAAFVQHERSVASRGEIELSLVTAHAADELHLGPTARLRWRPAGALSVTGTYARRHQFAQSLRNPESVVSNIFPADLYVGAGGSGLPVARSDVGIGALEWRPAGGMRLGVQAYARDFRGLALVAPASSGPAAASGFVEGSGRARGVAVEIGANGARYGIIASYGLQHVRLEYADTVYVPDHGAAHSIDAGVILFPSATSDIRLGVSSLLGRRTTAVVGAFEWEACNLLDQGCEFAGSPQQSDSLGAERLPPYIRVDVGLRKHWDVRFAGRDAQIAVFGSVTNVLGRKNVLTLAVDPATGERTRIEMRPRSPLVVGLDWRF